MRRPIWKAPSVPTSSRPPAITTARRSGAGSCIQSDSSRARRRQGRCTELALAPVEQECVVKNSITALTQEYNKARLKNSAGGPADVEIDAGAAERSARQP